MTEYKVNWWTMGPLQLVFTWYKIHHSGEQNCALGHLKQRKFKLRCSVLDVPVRNLLSSRAIFVPCDRQLQSAYSTISIFILSRAFHTSLIQKCLLQYLNPEQVEIITNDYNNTNFHHFQKTFSQLFKRGVDDDNGFKPGFHSRRNCINKHKYNSSHFTVKTASPQAYTQAKGSDFSLFLRLCLGR